MKKKDGPPNPPDADLWREIAKSVKAYKPAKVVTARGKPAPGAQNPEKRPAERQRAETIIPAAAPAQSKNLDNKGFDKATENKLRRGNLPLDGTLDLHGMTEAAAFAALLRFILSAAAMEKRTLLIITGKGKVSDGGGVLRRGLPLWLEDARLALYILALTPAQPKHGGTGAFYLRLRKKRD